MKRTYIKNLAEKTNETVTVKGWINARRNQGKMIFMDFRDATGIVQGIVLPGSAAMEVAKDTRPEWVVSVVGKINERPEKMQKPDVLNGTIEIEILEIEVLNTAETTPFEITENTFGKNEDVRLKYRYLDLRTERMQKNIRQRHKITSFVRNYFDAEGFVDVETPMLMKDTPEGSREYITPSRLWPGSFYALPQSPQQFKQLLMVAGFEKYYQVARCMRDEDLRGDRQPEFTQLDLEMSFVSQDDVRSLLEDMFTKLVEELYPEKHISQSPWPVLTYAEVMEKYNSDKPDLRKNKDDENELAFAHIVDFPMFEKMSDGSMQAMHHPFCSVHPDDEDQFMSGKDMLEIRANAYDVVLNGFELGSGSIRIHNQEKQKQVFDLLEITEEKQRLRFGHMLDAFTYGAPPHGGFAFGLDRVVMILENEPNIREVIAFPKTGEAKDLMMGAPSQVDSKTLEELRITLKNKENEE